MKILVCPLNWGLGHATRCVPIIRNYLANGHDVTIAADGFPLQFLKLTFPNLRILELPSYSVRYSAKNTQVAAMLRNLPFIIKGIYKEHQWLKKLLKTETFNLVISDNRFGLWTKQVECIYMTHQLMIKMPTALKVLEPAVWWLHRQIINQYNKCWIPDFEQNSGLSGDLAHKYPLPKNAQFIGIQTRFTASDSTFNNKSYDVVAIVSGIEPQRTLFENQLRKRFEKSDEKILIVCGKPTENLNKQEFENITLVSHLPDGELAIYLTGAKKIIARSGYSTIMDLNALNCLQKTEFIPTPGQTEQEYLAQFINSRKNVTTPSPKKAWFCS